MDIERPLSANERIKENSNFLRGGIAEGLTHAETGALSEDDGQLTKFHGFYQQDDRDLRAERGKQRMEKAFSFMVRMRIPAGIVTPAQWLTIEKLAKERANGTIRLTTRETVQFHGILKSNLRPLMQGLNAVTLDTIAACGDVNRNVIATVAPWQRDHYAAISTLARGSVRASAAENPRLARDLAGRGTDFRRRCRGRADLRADVSAAEIQDRSGVAAA